MRRTIFLVSAKFIKRIGIVGIANILISISGLIFIPIITKSFSTADYGVWSQVNTFVSLVPNIVNLGLPYTMVRFLAAEKDKTIIKQSFYSMMLLVLASTIVMIVDRRELSSPSNRPQFHQTTYRPANSIFL